MLLYRHIKTVCCIRAVRMPHVRSGTHRSVGGSMVRASHWRLRVRFVFGVQKMFLKLRLSLSVAIVSKVLMVKLRYIYDKNVVKNVVVRMTIWQTYLLVHAIVFIHSYLFRQLPFEGYMKWENSGLKETPCIIWKKFWSHEDHCHLNLCTCVYISTIALKQANVRAI